MRCKYFEARVTSLVVSKKSWTTILDMYPVFYPFCFQQTGTIHANCSTLTKEQMRKSNVVVATLTLGKGPVGIVKKNSPSHWKQDDRGKHLPGFDGNRACGGVEHGAKLGFFVSLWDDYLFQLKKTALLKTGSAIKYLDGKCMEMECHMLSLPVQGAQRSSSLAVHKSPTL